MRRLLRLVALALAVTLLAAIQGAQCDEGQQQPAPTEYECRPYIEKALQGLANPEATAEATENAPEVDNESTEGTEGTREKRSTDDGSSEESQQEQTAPTSEEGTLLPTEDQEEGLPTAEAPVEEGETASEEPAVEGEAVAEEATSSEEQVPTAEDEAQGTEESVPSGEEGVPNVEESEQSAVEGEVAEGEVAEGDDSGSSEESSMEVMQSDAPAVEEEAGQTVESSEESIEQAEADEPTEQTGESTESTEQTAEESTESTEQTAEGSGESTEETAEGSGESTKETAEGLEESTEETAEGLGESTEETAESSGESREETGEGSGESTEETAESSGESREETAESTGESKEETAEGSGESTESAAEESTESTEQVAEGETAQEAPAAGESTESIEQAEINEAAVESTDSAETAEQGTEEPAAESAESTEQAAEQLQEEVASEESSEQAVEGEAVEREGVEVEAVESEVVEGEAAEVIEGQAAEPAAEEEATSEEAAVEEAPIEATESAPLEAVQADEEAEPTPEEELSYDVEIPENLRPREHIAQILRLDEDSIEDELLVGKTVDSTLKDLKRFYDSAIKPLEILYKYRDLSNRHFGDPEIFSKPLILFMGPWSGGKSSIINYLLDNEYKRSSLRTGAEPSPAYFNILMHGEREEVLDGTQLAADWTFSGLQKFGQGLLDRLRGLRLNNRLLEKVNIVEIPGILEIRKQVERLFPFNDACQWFIDRADIIFLVYDPAKLDVGPETEAILDQLKGREYQTRIVLNKADQVRPEELMRVQGTLIWNISPLMSSTQPPVMYSTSLWSMPYEMGAPLRLLRAQERAFLRDMREAIDRRVENKIASARRFAVRVRNHAKMVDCYLTTYYNHKSFFGNRKKIADDIIEKPQDYHIYEGLSTLTNISRYDLPDPETYRDFFRVNPLYEFELLSSTCTYFKGCPINRLDVAIAYDLPELVGKYKKATEIALETHKKS